MRKAAQTRLALVDAMVAALSERPFAKITVRSLCAEVSISEPTFFKHFPAKEDVLVLFVQLWSVGLAARFADDSLGGHEVVAELFEETARQIRTAPRVMHEIIAHQMRSESAPRLAPPSPAELVLRFGDGPGVREMKPVAVQDLIRRGLERARELGEIPRDTVLADATWALVALFFGVPASTRSPNHIARRYRRSLALVWAGLASGGAQ